MLKSRIVLPCAVLLLAMTVIGCSRSEDEARKLLEKGRAVRQEKALDRAEAILESLLQEFPRTRAAAAAREELRELRRERLAVIDAVEGVLDRLATVLDGYRAFTGDYPRTLEDLNRGDYFFDVAYLQTIVPEGVEAYVAIAPAGKFRLWAFNPSYRVAMFRAAGQDRAHLSDQTAEELAEQGRIEPVGGNLSRILPSAVAQHD